MSDSDVYLPSASSTESCDTSHSSNKEEMEVATTVQPYEGEPRASNEDFDEDVPKPVRRIRPIGDRRSKRVYFGHTATSFGK